MPPDASKPAGAGGPTVTENVTVAQSAQTSGEVGEPAAWQWAQAHGQNPHWHRVDDELELAHRQKRPDLYRLRPLYPAAGLQTLTAENARLRERVEAAERNLRVVQNAAKGIANAHGTELEHLRQNHTFDYRLRAEHESLQARDAEMTEALEAAESQLSAARQTIERLTEALRHAAVHIEVYRAQLRNPIDQITALLERVEGATPCPCGCEQPHRNVLSGVPLLERSGILPCPICWSSDFEICANLIECADCGHEGPAQQGPEFMCDWREAIQDWNDAWAGSLLRAYRAKLSQGEA